MKTLKVNDILKVTNGKLVYGNEETECIDFCKDTRVIKENDIYIGFKGEKVDGSTFYETAFNNGAKGCIINEIDNIKEVKDKFVIVVEDTVKAIGQIAKLKRQMYNIPVVAITGSVGKTSTKDMIYSVVATKYKTLKTQGNMNNEIGMPLTILNLKDEEALVLEMGMNHLGELSRLTNIAKPTIAVITNVGTAHIGNLGSRENILKAKLEILEGLNDEGVAIINNDNDLLHKWYEEQNTYKVITFGINNESNNMAKNINYTNSGSTFKYMENKIEVPVGGEAFVYNSLAAISVGKVLDIPIEKIKSGILNFELSKMRLDVIKKNGYTIINDCYNANFDSMKSSIEYLRNCAGKRKIAVLGDMLELGDFSKELHEKVGMEVAKNNIDILITVGKESKNIARVAKENGTKEIYEFENNADAINKIKEIMQNDDVILVKASNSMKFKEIVECL